MEVLPPWRYAFAVAACCAPVAGWAVHAPGPVAAAVLTVAALAPLLCVVDAASLRLPDALVLPLTGAVLGLLTLAGADPGPGGGADPHPGVGAGLGRAAAGGVLLGGAHLLLAVLPGSGLGFGDVKLAAVLGLVAGRLGWPAVAIAAVVPYLLAGPVAGWLLVTGRVARGTRLAFGPYLLAGALLAVLTDA